MEYSTGLIISMCANVVILICLLSPNVCMFIHKHFFEWKQDTSHLVPLDLKEGDEIEITYLPPCKNNVNGQNPYIGMKGTVVDLYGDKFDLFTGTSWLVGVNLNTCKFVKL